MQADHSRTGQRLAVVAEAFPDRSLTELLDWVREAAPSVSGLELGSGGYAPHPHCDPTALLSDRRARRGWQAEFEARDLAVAALNAWGNPIHPDHDLATAHDRALRETIRLAALLGVDRVVVLAGGPPGAPGDRTPYFAAGGWLPYLEGIYEHQWDTFVAPYWSGLSEFARAEAPGLLICIELHPGTPVYNVETFSRLAALGPNLAANIDPSHFFWQRIDPYAVLDALRERIGHVHAKDVSFNHHALALNGLLDHRWTGRSTELSWRFATVGAGHDRVWWSRFLALLQGSPARWVAIEHEDPELPPERGIPRAARLLEGSLANGRSRRRRTSPVGTRS